MPEMSELLRSGDNGKMRAANESSALKMKIIVIFSLAALA